MKKVIVTMIVCLVASMTVLAQDKPAGIPECKSGKPGNAKLIGSDKAKEWMNQKREQRRAFVVKGMGLTETETAAFNAIYDDYYKKISVSKRMMNRTMKALNDTLSDAEFEKNLDILNAQKLEQAKIDNEFYNAMKKTLPIKKVYLYYKADKEFNKLMMKEMQQPMKKPEKKVEK